MRQYKFDKPLVETALPVRDMRAYYVYVDEKTNELANIMEFKNGQWQVKHFVDDIDIWNRSSTRLNIPNKIKLNPNGIIAAWLNGSDYESAVKEAAYDFSYIVGKFKTLVEVVSESVDTINNILDSIVSDVTTELSDEVTAIATEIHKINEQVEGIVDDEAIDHLEALDVAINGETSEDTNSKE